MTSALLSLFAVLLGCAAVQAADLISDEYAPSPAGYVLKECMHRVPSGSRLQPHPEGGLRVHDMSGDLLFSIPPCDTRNGTRPTFKSHRKHQKPLVGASKAEFPQDYDGWLAYTAFNYTPGFTSFLGDFSVPALPANDPEVLYLFTGLQNIDWIPVVDPEPSTPFDIIQPVLQYPGDDGNYWSVKSWYVTLDVGTVESQEVPLAVGDFVFGNMTQVGPSEWYIGSFSGATGKSTSIHVNHPRLKSQPWAYNTLECYGCSGCSTYPENSPCKFTNLALVSNGQNIPAQWRINPKPSHMMQCHEKPIVTSSEVVTIDFGNNS